MLTIRISCPILLREISGSHQSNHLDVYRKDSFYGNIIDNEAIYQDLLSPPQIYRDIEEEGRKFILKFTTLDYNHEDDEGIRGAVDVVAFEFKCNMEEINNQIKGLFTEHIRISCQGSRDKTRIIAMRVDDNEKERFKQCSPGAFSSIMQHTVNSIFTLIASQRGEVKNSIVILIDKNNRAIIPTKIPTRWRLYPFLTQTPALVSSLKEALVLGASAHHREYHRVTGYLCLKKHMEQREQESLDRWGSISVHPTSSFSIHQVHERWQLESRSEGPKAKRQRTSECSCHKHDS